MEHTKKLAEYQLFIHPIDFSELRRDIWIDEPIPAKLTVNKKRYNIDLAYRGSHIREFEKKSYHIIFRKQAMYRNAKEWHLNAEFMDPSLIRNKLSLDFFKDIGSLAPTSRFVNLKINGKNEGVYLELESVDEYFLENQKLPKGAIFYAVDGDANFSLMSELDQDVKKSLELGYERKCGTMEDEYALHEFIIKVNTISRVDFEKEIVRYLNVEKYIAWLAGVVFTQNYDGFVHNYALYRNGESGLFEMIPWDYDATWGRDIHGELMAEDYLRIEGFNTLTARILNVKTFRHQYQKRLEDILQHQFTVEYMKPKIRTLMEVIRPYILKDRYVNKNIYLFDKEEEMICGYIEARTRYLKNNINILN